MLERVLDRGQPFDETFAGHPQLERLAGRDRAFARLLVTTTLRRLGQIDAVLGTFVARSPKSARVDNLLRLGAAQLLFLETPAHAAVGETVALARGRESFARGLANAVLRRVAAEGQALVAGQDPARLNTPDWLWRSWCRAYGEERTRAIALAHLIEPPLDVTVKTDPEHWAERLGGEHLYANTVRRAGASSIGDLPGYAEGAFWVQDAAAALPALLLGQARGRSVVDLCAAPGGKTAQLAAAGATVVAVEMSKTRAERLRVNLDRLRLGAEVVVADALSWRPAEPVAHVLLDAPCTSTGTIRRHPDIARHKTPEEVSRMAELQERLLAAAISMLAPGGTVVYASCSLQPEEGQAVIERALQSDLPIERSPIEAAELRGLPAELGADGAIRTLPCHLAGRGGMDGFFVARLRRRG